MVNIEPKKVTEQDLAEWWRLAEHLATIKQSEHFSRVAIFKGFFPDPREGTNTHTLSDGFNLKAVHVVNRTIEIEVLNAMRQQFAEAGINYVDLIEWKPVLKKSAYNELTKEQRHLFDQCLTVKEGSPQLDIVPPSAKQQEALAAAAQNPTHAPPVTGQGATGATATPQTGAGSKPKRKAKAKAKKKT